MTVENKVQQFANNFWKYASNTKGVLALEDAYINWANNSGMTIKEFGHVWAKINDDVCNKYGLKKADISFSRTDDILDLVELLKNIEPENIESNDIENLIEPEIKPEPGLAGPPKEPLPEMSDKSSPPPTPEENIGGEPAIPEGGAETSPDLKLTESLLL